MCKTDQEIGSEKESARERGSESEYCECTGRVYISVYVTAQ